MMKARGLITGERHLRLILKYYVDRPLRYAPATPGTAAETAPRTRTSVRRYAGMRILRRDRLGGLIHEYAQVA